MAERFEQFDVTIPAGTLETAPQTTVLDMPDGIVRTISVVVPDGCAGFVGFQLLYGPTRIVPHTTSGFYIANNETLHFPMERFPTGQAWRVRAYNEGVYEHTLHLRFDVDELRAGGAGTFLPVAIG